MNTRQIERVAPSLTPKQLVLAWIKEMQSYPSVEEFARESAHRPPLRTVRDRVDQSVRARFRQASKDVIRSELSRAHREARFLVNLAMQCTFELLTGEEAFHLKHGVAVFVLDNIRLRLEHENKEGPVALAEVEDWLSTLHAGCLGYQRAVKVIETDYFDGHSILSRDVAANLAARFQLTDPLVARLELDRTAIQERCTPVAQAHVSRWIRMAKAEVHAAMGEPGSARRLALLAMGP